MDEGSLDQDMMQVLRGRATIRQTPSNMVRVFISSTFSGKKNTVVEEYTCPLDMSSVL